MFPAREYRVPADESDPRAPLVEAGPEQLIAEIVQIRRSHRIRAGHAGVVSVMGPPNRAPGAGVMGGPDASHTHVMGGPDRCLGVGVMGGPDRGPRLGLMGESDSRFVDHLFAG
jgi:hypothetical protein